MDKSTSQIRAAFLDFFGKRKHEVVPSAPLVPQNDPTLMFNNAGMVQFKDVFTGKEARGYQRAASSQKCIRISGKHNDLEEVGPSPRHQTFFEMLGNFSFGDYFKEEAILYAWEFLKELDLPRERLLVTYFQGEEGIAADTTARDLWGKIAGFGEDRVRALGMADNFWSMGETGPCGPCSEIYFYNGPDPDPGRFGSEQTPEGHGWIEIWNLVFMQFERSSEGGSIITRPLPKPSIDTGAGLERLASVVQGSGTNYGVDLLANLVEEAAQLAKKPYGGSMAPDDVSMRVIADHARTTAFLIAEGILPDRTGRPYVLRRVMRRAIRHGHRLGIAEPFLHKIAARVIATMGEQYPELRERADLIASVAEAEEVRFRQTIERGLSLLDERFDHLASSGVSVLDGRDAFRLYDTYGFPLDLTEVICKERGLSVDAAGYEQALEEARKKSEFRGVDQAVEDVYRTALQTLPPAGVTFLGYDVEATTSPVLALLQGGQVVTEAGEGTDVELITGETPFYGESGGQVGDQGVITAAGVRIEISDTQKPLAGLVVHRGRVTQGTVTTGLVVRLEVDHARRERTRRNHSATHLLHWALRQVLGAHAAQKGSLVGPERLRFDFTHNAPLAPQEILEIERLVNEQTLANHPIRTEVLSMEQAKKRGAMMIFEEKYGDTVRMLTMGPSTELCGGTHARATGEIGLFKITSEQGVAAGVRRILATTGEGSFEYVHGLSDTLARAAALFKATPDHLLERIEKSVERQKALEREIEGLQRKLLTGGGGVDSLLGRARDVGGVRVVGVKSEVSDRAALRELAEQLRDKLGEAVVLVGAVDGDKAALVVTVSKGLTARFRAGELIKPAAEKVGGSGGGRPDMAQAGGTNPAGLDAAIESIYDVVAGAAE